MRKGLGMEEEKTDELNIIFYLYIKGYLLN